MAHFAKLDDNNMVLEVIVVDDADAAGGVYPASDPAGKSFLKRLTGHSNWKQTSYNRNFRVNFAAIGGTYDADRDAFIQPKLDNTSWVLDEETLSWKRPVERPDITGLYHWDESTTSWIPY